MTQWEILRKIAIRSICNFLEKEKFLVENGWMQLWSPDNWIKREVFIRNKGNIDMMGISTDDAYEVEVNQTGAKFGE